MESRCRSGCKTKTTLFNKRNIYSFLPGIIVVLIPKCPFCILTYTSAITLCSSKSFSAHAPQWTIWISVSLSLLTLLITLYNYKGSRTLLAAFLILLGTTFIIYAELFISMMSIYYWGCSILILGVWVNGSLPSLIRSMFSKQKHFMNSHKSILTHSLNLNKPNVL